MTRPKFTISECFFLYMVAGKSGFPATFVDEVLRKVVANTISGRPAHAPKRAVSIHELRAMFANHIREEHADLDDAGAESIGKMFAKFERLAGEGAFGLSVQAELDDLPAPGLMARLWPATAEDGGDKRSSISKGRKLLKGKKGK